MNFPWYSQHRSASLGVHWAILSGVVVCCCQLGESLYFIVISVFWPLENIHHDFQWCVS